MDEIDCSILSVLKKNGRTTASEISRNVNLSAPLWARERMKKMEVAHIIEHYTTRINRKEMGLGLVAFILVTLENTEDVQAFRRAIIQYDAVLECHHIAGEYDYLLKVLVEDAHALELFLSNSLKGIKGVSKSNTIISLLTLKEEINA